MMINKCQVDLICQICLCHFRERPMLLAKTVMLLHIFRYPAQSHPHENEEHLFEKNFSNQNPQIQNQNKKKKQN